MHRSHAVTARLVIGCATVTAMKNGIMKRNFAIFAVGLLALAGCSSSDGDSADTDAEVEAESSEQDPAAATNGAPQALCDALGPLDQAIDDLDGDSVEELEAQFDVVQERFDDVQSAAGGQYTEELAQFESGLNEFEAELQSASGDPISGLIGLVDATADLAVAGEALDEQIDCPNGSGSDAEAETEAELEQEEAEIDQEADEAEQELESEL